RGGAARRRRRQPRAGRAGRQPAGARAPPATRPGRRAHREPRLHLSRPRPDRTRTARVVGVVRRRGRPRLLDRAVWLGVHAARALRRRRAATVSVGLAAVAALGWLAGPGAVTAALLDVGWGVVLIIAQEIVAHVLNALGWRFAFARKHAAGLRFPELVRLRVAGDAVNYLTPSATIAGEIARAAMLRGPWAADVAAASIVVAKTAQTLAQGFVIGAGVVALGARLSPGRPAISVLIGSAVAIAGTVLLLMRTHRGRSLAARAWPWLAAIGRR